LNAIRGFRRGLSVIISSGALLIMTAIALVVL
jgi:hypothetical protein